MSTQSLSNLLDGFFAGQRGALARLLSIVENDLGRADEIVDTIFTETGTAQIVGVTGPPGAGKSTLVNALIHGSRARDKSVAVLAVDPSSALTGGAALGDRIRMLETWNDDDVYVRSMAARGQLGGLSAAVFGAIHLLDAFGFDMIYIETVGVGQAEIDIATVADTTVLVQVPGLGDTIQLIKAGVLEIADVLVVNKADQPGASELLKDIRGAISHDVDGWYIPVLATNAVDEDGIGDLLDAIEEHEHHRLKWDTERRAHSRIRAEVRQLAINRSIAQIDDFLKSDLGVDIIKQVQDRRLGPRAAAGNLASKFRLDPETPSR